MKIRCFSSSVRSMIVPTVAMALMGLTACQSKTKWAGTWELKEPGSEASIKVILSEDGKLYMIPPESPQFGQPPKTAYELPLKRVSDDTKIPEGYTVTNLEEEAKKQAELAKKEEGKQYVGGILRAQQAYQLEKNKFASTFEELQLPIKNETDNFVYKMTPSSDLKANVIVTASAKNPEYKSYSGAVFKVKDGKEDTSKIIICETNENSTTAPAAPILEGKELKCSEGSTILQ